MALWLPPVADPWLRLKRCYRCLAIGHHKEQCHNLLTCAKCASTGHSEEECTSIVEKCAGCGGPHRFHDYKRCPKLQLAQAKLRERTQ